MRLYIISALAIAFLAILFALQNTNLVTIHLFIWAYRQSLALVLLGTLALGTLIGLLVSVPAIIQRGWQTARVRKEADTLSDLLQAKDEVITTESRKIQAVQESYSTLLDSLGLIESTTGLLKTEQLPKAIMRQLQQLQDPSTRWEHLSLLMLKVQSPPVDGLVAEQLWGAIAQTLQHHASTDSWFYSDGQGLFVATTPGLEAKAANRYGETLQAAILEHLPTLPDGKSVELEVSVGGAIAPRQSPVDAPTLISTAQAALDQAQKRGRNRLHFLPISS